MLPELYYLLLCFISTLIWAAYSPLQPPSPPRPPPPLCLEMLLFLFHK